MVTGSLLALGFLHGLGADHLMAIAALSIATPGGGSVRYGRAFWLATRFAAGHAILLAVGTVLAIVLGWQIPVWLERAGELAGGWLLIALGALGIWLAATGRVAFHTHAHIHGDQPPHAHWHLHVGHQVDHRGATTHAALPAIIGAVFAVSGLRALMLALPMWSAPSSIRAVILSVALFGVGILLSMSLFGILLAHALDARLTARLARGAAALTAIGSIGLGIYWIQ